MKGMNVLVVALGAVTETLEPLRAALYISRFRPMRDLDALETEVLKHLGAVEDLLAHIRRMRVRAENPDPLEGVFGA